jgi:hypothetical protein
MKKIINLLLPVVILSVVSYLRVVLVTGKRR